MTREPIINENELNNNPLLRKMRDRFTCSGNMTIGEIMRHRAERDNHSNVTPVTYVAPVAKRETAASRIAAEDSAKALASPMRSGRRALILSCLAVALCTVVLLAFILPVMGDFAASANETSPEGNEIINVSVPDTSEPPVEEKAPASSYDNVVNAFQNTFAS